MTLSQLIRALCLVAVCFGVSLSLHSQVYTDPPFPQEEDDITVFYDASQGNAALLDCGCDIYIHSGVITDASTSPTDWQNVQTQWATTNAEWRLQPVSGSPGLYSISFNIRDFYGLDASTDVRRLAFVFRNGDGSIVGRGPGGGDIYYDLLPDDALFELRVLAPTSELTVREGDQIRLYAAATQDVSSISWSSTSGAAGTTSRSVLDTLITAEPGFQTITLLAQGRNGSSVLRDGAEVSYFATTELAAIDLPPGIEYGYNDLGNGRSGFYFYAPLKERAYLRGYWGFINSPDASNYVQLAPLTDGTGFYGEIPTPTQGEIVYQYGVEGSSLIADPFSELVIDPNNDSFIDEATFPGIPDFQGAGPGSYATWVRDELQFPWQHDDYERPADGDLVIYELLVRDFTEQHNYQALIDSIGYFERLGINAIQLMPVNEFENNESWGYNPSYHMALDKYYGTPEKLKEFIDLAHSKGIAVILDVVFNHGFGQNPYVQLYSAERAAAPDGAGPFFNVNARHPFNVGQDANHESIHMQRYTGRILRHMIEEFHFDGFRFDLSKGFTQTSNPDDVGAWGRYDASRVAILKGYQDSIRNVDPDSYVILEHFAESREEQELTDAGMFVWGNMNHNYSEAAMGYAENDLYGVTPQSRGFNNPRLVGYMESHDEERIQYRVDNFGNRNGDYNTRAYSTSLARQELITNFFYTTPGAKMLWQFGEFGYDVPIDFNGRTGNKPQKWFLLERAANERLLNVTSSLIKLRRDYDVFAEGDHQLPGGLSQGFTKSMYIDGDDMDVLVVGNFDVRERTAAASFPAPGTFYDYWTGDSITVTGAAGSRPFRTIPLQPGEYRLYTSQQLDEPDGGYLREVSDLSAAPAGAEVALSPSVAADVARLRVRGWEANTFSAVALDAMGREVLSFNTVGDGQEIDLTPLAPGTYQLRVIDDRGRAAVLRFVKQ